MRKLTFLLLVAIGCAAQQPTPTDAADTKNKRLLLVTHSGGFVHPSVATAEEVLKQVGPANGFDVTCWRFTEDPDAKVKTKDGKETTALEKYATEKFRGPTRLPVEREHCGRINKDTLKNFDAVLFFTTGNPVTKEE